MPRTLLSALLAVALGPVAAAQTWTFQGPAGIQNGQASSTPNTVSGAVGDILAPSTAPGTYYIGGVNGGVWKSTNSGASWTPLTDFVGSTSVGRVALDPSSVTTIATGFGRGASSYAGDGGRAAGFAYSLDGGSNWTTQYTLPAETQVTGVAVRNLGTGTGTAVLSANDYSQTFSRQGVFRSTNGGSSFTQISGASGTGLPAMGAYPLAENASNPSQLFVAPYQTTGTYSLYRSNDTGTTWTSVGNTTLNDQIFAASNLRISAAGNVAVVAISANATTPTVWRSGDGGTTWTQASNVPTVNPGNQGSIHLNILLDPTDPTGNRVYLTGDATQTSPFNGIVYRGDLSTNTWTPLYTNGSNAPHADGRALTLDPATGNLLQGNDGGLFRLPNPSGSFGTWTSLNTGLGITELHSIGYDPVSKVIFGGAQDNGTSMQTGTGSTSWTAIQGGDGGTVGVVRDPNNANQSIRYTSFQNYGGFTRTTWNAAGGQVSSTAPALTVSGSGQSIYTYENANGSGIQFYGPVATNRGDGNRLYLGTRRVYESTNQGGTLNVLKDFGTGVSVTSLKADGFTGTTAKPLALWVTTSTGQVWYRPDTGGPSLLQATAYPGAGTAIVGLDAQPTNWQHIVVASASQVHRSTDQGVTFTTITGNLLTGNPGAGVVTAVATMNFSNAFGSRDVYLAGARDGLYATTSDALGTWTPFGAGLPNTQVTDIRYDPTDDVLVVGTLGRGAWSVAGFSVYFTPVPEPTTTLLATALPLAAGAWVRRRRAG